MEWYKLNLATLSLFLICISPCYNFGKHGHDHYWPEDENTNLFHDPKILTDWEHLKEDFKDRFDFDLREGMPEEEMEALYFQLHDLDGDEKLDGLEILAALNHVGGEPPKSQEPENNDEAEIILQTRKQRKWNAKFNHDARIIDDILKGDDTDNDGYISYFEFIFGARSKNNLAYAPET